jgi:hypothetical protein
MATEERVGWSAFTWGVIAVGIGFLSFYQLVMSGHWPPAFVERAQQRRELHQRVRTAGGWASLRAECLQLASRTNSFQWFRGTPRDGLSSLPAIAVLKPRQVELTDSIVRIKVFGAHATGGHSTPYFGLEIVCATNHSHRPQPHPAAAGNGFVSYRQVSEGVFEIF